MSPTGSERGGDPSSTRTVEGVIRECEAVKSALARARWMRLLLLLAVAGFVGASAWKFYELGMRLKGEENLKQLETLAKRRLLDNNDKYMGEVQLLVDHSSPVVTQAFYAQAKKDLPAFMEAMGKERATFADELQSKMIERLDAHYKAAFAKRMALMEAEFPELKDPDVRDRLVENLTTAARSLVQKYYVDEMKGQLTAMYDAWDHFPAADAASPGDPPLEDQFIATLLELLTFKLTHAEQAAAAQP